MRKAEERKKKKKSDRTNPLLPSEAPKRTPSEPWESAAPKKTPTPPPKHTGQARHHEIRPLPLGGGGVHTLLKNEKRDSFEKDENRRRKIPWGGGKGMKRSGRAPEARENEQKSRKNDTAQVIKRNHEKLGGSGAGEKKKQRKRKNPVAKICSLRGARNTGKKE